MEHPRLDAERWMFDRASDFYMIAEKPNQAYSTLLDGIDTFEFQKRPDNFDELPGLRARLQRFFTGRTALDNVK